jgi:hypothetical protein
VPRSRGLSLHGRPDPAKPGATCATRRWPVNRAPPSKVRGARPARAKWHPCARRAGKARFDAHCSNATASRLGGKGALMPRPVLPEPADPGARNRLAVRFQSWAGRRPPVAEIKDSLTQSIYGGRVPEPCGSPSLAHPGTRPWSNPAPGPGPFRMGGLASTAWTRTERIACDPEPTDWGCWSTPRHRSMIIN